MSSATPTPARSGRLLRQLSPAGALRLRRPSDIWFKPALSSVVAVAPPNLTLLALGRLDLAMYTMAGSLCALYAHNRPYAARARALAWVVLGMLAGVAVALVTASLTDDAAVLVAVGALLAAAQKALCDATRVGPPGNVVLTFISSACLFVPQTLGQVPGHLALAAAAGAWAWLVGMAPGLVRPHGPSAARPPARCSPPPRTPRPAAPARATPRPGPPGTPPCRRPGSPCSPCRRQAPAPPPGARWNGSSSAPRWRSPHPPTPTPACCAAGPAACGAPAASPAPATPGPPPPNSSASRPS